MFKIWTYSSQILVVKMLMSKKNTHIPVFQSCLAALGSSIQNVPNLGFLGTNRLNELHPWEYSQNRNIQHDTTTTPQLKLRASLARSCLYDICLYESLIELSFSFRSFPRPHVCLCIIIILLLWSISTLTRIYCDSKPKLILLSYIGFETLSLACSNSESSLVVKSVLS